MKDYFGSGYFGMGDAPTLPSVDSLLVTKDIAGNVSAAQAAGQQLYTQAGQMANAVQAGAGQVQQYGTQLSALLSNGVSLSGITAADVASALKTAAPIVNNLGAIPRVLLSVGLAAASGAVVGGPVGAFIGGASAALTAAFSSGPAKTPPPSTGANQNLGRLQNWCAQHPTGLQAPVGWYLYDWVSQTRRVSQGGTFGNHGCPPGTVITPICTPWLWGAPTNACDPYGTFSAATGTQAQASNEVIGLPGQDPMQLAAQAAARAPDPFFYAVNYGGVVSCPSGHQCGPAPDGLYSVQCTGCGPLGLSDTWTFVTRQGVGPAYGYLYGLGTVFAMLSAGASDQSIAAELLMQQHLLNTFPTGASNGVTDAGDLTTLTDVFLNRLHTKAEAVSLGLVASTPAFVAQQQQAAVASSGVAATATAVALGGLGAGAAGVGLYALATHQPVMSVAKMFYGRARKLVHR